MFVIDLHYIQPLVEIEKHLQAHIVFLEKEYSAGNFICSGRKNPRTGGIILCLASNKDTVLKLIEEDPFKQHQLAEYRITEFIPTKCVKGFDAFLDLPQG